MNARLRRVYLVSQPVGVVRHTGQDIGISGEVTGALTTTVLSGDKGVADVTRARNGSDDRAGGGPDRPGGRVGGVSSAT